MLRAGLAIAALIAWRWIVSTLFISGLGYPVMGAMIGDALVVVVIFAESVDRFILHHCLRVNLRNIFDEFLLIISGDILGSPHPFLFGSVCVFGKLSGLSNIFCVGLKAILRRGLLADFGRRTFSPAAWPVLPARTQ
jgi:hypothetical protein